MPSRAAKPDVLLPYPAKQVFAALMAMCCCVGMYGQRYDRLVILADGDRINPTLQAQIVMLEADFRQFFSVADIQIIRVETDQLQERASENAVKNIEEGLLKMQELCREPDRTIVIAFVFLEGKGPTYSQIESMLEQAQSEVKILSNVYFRNTLTDLGCGRYAVLDYTRGEVKSRDTIETDEREFPIIPVVGGGVLIGTAIVLLADRGGIGCDAVDPSWQAPAGLCSDDTPVQLLVTGTQGGNWSGTGVNSNGLFDASSGTQAVTYSVGEGSCRQSSTQTVEVGSADASWPIPSQPCEGQNVVLVPNTTGGTWTGPGIIQNPNSTANFSQANAGTYNVTYSITLGACSASSSQDITVLPDADPGWVIPDPLCVGESAELMPSITSFGHWTGVGITDHGNGTATFFADNAGTFSVTYTAGTGECEASLTQEIEVSSNPDASWSSPSGLCTGEEVMLAPVGTAGGSWSGPGVTNHGDGTATFIQNAPGTYSITYTATLGDCIASQTQDIIVINQADPSWTSPGEVCSGNVYALSPSGTPGGAWTGQGITDHGDGTASFVSNEAGTYSVTYAAGTGACEASLSMDIIVIQTPDASWSLPPNALCAGDSYELMSSGSPGGMWSGQGVIDHGDGTATFSQTEAGAYEVTYMVITGPCSASLTQTIMVISQPDASWAPPSNVCAGDQVTLVPSGTMGGMWSGNSVMDLGDGTALFTPSEAGSYTILYTIGQGSCEASLAQDVEVFPLPDAGWSLPSGVCTGQVVVLSPNGTTGGTWSGDGITDLGNGTANFSQEKPGLYNVTYSVTTGPCTSSLSQDIEVVNQPDPAWTIPTDVCSGQEILLVPDGTSGGTWSGPGVTDLGNGTAHFIQNSGGSYNVTYSVGQGGCEQSLSQDIPVNDAGDPSWTPPSDIICPNAVVDLVAAEGTWSGNGVTDLGGGLGQFMANEPGIYTITLSVGSGNCTATESHDVEVGDVDPPVIEVPASDMTVSCDGNGNVTELQDWLDTHGGAEASDLCSSTITWEHDFTDFPFDCGMSGTTTVTFTATDEEGNSATTIGDFTIQDIDSPVFEDVPPDITVPCDAIPPPEPVIATDQCSGDAGIVFEELPPGTNCPYEIIRIWTATDACGNESTAQQTITATDNEAPQPQTMPHDTIINCPGPPEQCIPPPEQVQFTDNCDADPTVMMTEEIQQMPGMILIIRCWTATDDCGNMSSQVCQQIVIFGEGGNIQQEASSEISLTVSPSSNPETSNDLHSLFLPANAFWEDPGLIFTSQDIPGKVGTITRLPPVAIILEFPLEPGISLVAGGGLGKAEIFRHYKNVRDDYKLSGFLDQQFYHLGLRFIPEKVKNVYFITGVQYTQYHITDLRLIQSHHIAYAQSDLKTFNFSHVVGAGARFKIGDFCRLNIASNYSTQTTSTLYVQIELNITRLFSSTHESYNLKH